jgi:peptide/nickel transport system permease protein
MVDIETDVPCRLRDGVVLRADVYRPRADEPLPVLVMRLPYGKQVWQAEGVPSPRRLAAAGYIVVVKDVRGREIALVSQEPMVALDPNFTIGSQLSEVVPLTGAATGKGDVRKRVRELLTSVHLPDPDAVARRHPHELSGGMLQRVVIAMALAASPRLLIADEPTTALDVTVQAGILDLLRSLRDERGMAIILITHDLGVVADTCDRAIVMERGRIVEEGSVADIFYAPHHPYTKKLIASTPNIARTEGRVP